MVELVKSVRAPTMAPRRAKGTAKMAATSPRERMSKLLLPPAAAAPMMAPKPAPAARPTTVERARWGTLMDLMSARW